MKKCLGLFVAMVCALFASPLVAGSLKVNLAPTQAISAGAQWRVDGGSWRNSGATVSGLTNGAHVVSYKTVSGWIAPAAATVTISSGTTTITGTYVSPASLKITLTPASGQWRIDGGAWRSSGATVTGLTPGAHTIDYQAVANYTAPPAESVTLVAGRTTTLARSYLQLGGLKATLAPSSAQWRVDGGAWRASGTTVTDLAPGGHTVDYQAVNNYAAPPSEAVTVISGQTTAITRSYVAQSSLGITLSPATAQWRVDGGTWLASGTVVTGLTPGSHAVDYQSVNHYAAPASEAVALIAGQTTSLTRTYVPLASVSVTLTPAMAQWRIDGGNWQSSAAVVTNLAAGSHSIEYQAVAGYLAPPPENVTLANGQDLAFARSYTALSAVEVTLEPAQGQWRLDGGVWRSSGTVAADLLPGAHTLEFISLNQHDSPPVESVVLTSGQTLQLSRSYVALAQVSISTEPAIGEWRLNGGTWNASGATQFVPPGDYAIEYASLPLYDSPASEQITLAAAGVFAATRTYVSQKPSLSLTLTPAQGQWRIDGGAWNASEAVLNELDAGSHLVEYAPPGDDYQPLAAETVVLELRQHATLARTFGLKPSSVSVALTPVAGQWRVTPVGVSPGGAWVPSGATVGELIPGDYTLEFASVDNYDAPANETITLAPDQHAVLARDYVGHPAQLTMTLTPGSASWQISPAAGGSDGVWHASGETVVGLAAGDYQVTFSAVDGYTTPPAETVTLAVGDSPTWNRAYTQLASLSVLLDPANGQWRVDDGAWVASGVTLTNLQPGSHVISYAPLPDHVAPPSEPVVLVPGANPALSRSYAADPAFAVTYAFEDAGNLPVMIRGSDGFIYGVACTGLTNQLGHLFRMNIDGTGFQRLRNFALDTGGGAGPSALIEGSDGVLYGTLRYGSSNTSTQSNGQVYRVNRDGSGFAVLCTFNQPNQGAPNTLVEGPTGVLYGTSVGNGATTGNIFRVNRDGTGFEILRSLFSGWGSNPQGLAWTSAGFFVGTARAGGPSNAGALFKFNADGTGYALLKGFAGGADGADPRAAVRTGSDGRLYGATYAGGAASRGLIYALNADGSGYQVLRSFSGPDGQAVEFALTEDASGALVGCTLGGGASSRGALFRINKDGTGYTVLRSFAGTVTEGGNPRHVLVPLGNGSYLGANTYSGGAAQGTVFSVTADGSNLTVLRSLGSPGGGSPWSPLTSDGAGVFYGVTSFGGAANRGAIYRINEDGSGYTVLRSLAGTTFNLPVGGLLLASDGKLYGTSYNSNILFSLAADGSGYTVLRTFATFDTMWGGVIEGSDGLLYGASGTSVFRLAKDGSGFVALHTFAGGASDGTAPMAGLLQGADGRLYGTTLQGGAANVGTLFAIAKDGTGYVILRHFAGGVADGGEPWADLVQGDDGTLYGTTSKGGPANAGAIFRINRDGSGYTVLKYFGASAPEASQPGLGALLVRDGYLYGTTTSGGAFSKGTLYRLRPDGTGFEILVNFGMNGSDAAYPYARVVVGSDGCLYGTTSQGPVAGTIYRLRVD